MSTIVLVVLVILFGTFVVPVLQALFTDEARGWLPHLARAVVRRAARRLPPAHRERYEDEWLAELAAYSDRRLTALVRACSLWIGARAMRAQFGGEVAPTRAAILDRGEQVPFAVSVVTWVDEEARQKDLPKLEKEIEKTIDSYEAERDARVLELHESLERRMGYLRTGKQTGFSDDDLLWADTLEVNLKKLTDDEREKMATELGKQFDADLSDTEAYIEDASERMRLVWELFQSMKSKQVIADETLFRELKDRFGSPFGWGEYFRGGMGA